MLGPQEGDDAHIYFEPLVPLPEKIEVKTGEEDEDVLFESRAKLFRFVGGEWKERGLGVLKILQHRESGRIRLLMRREQVGSWIASIVCCMVCFVVAVVVVAVSESCC